MMYILLSVATVDSRSATAMH